MADETDIARFEGEGGFVPSPPFSTDPEVVAARYEQSLADQRGLTEFHRNKSAQLARDAQLAAAHAERAEGRVIQLEAQLAAARESAAALVRLLG